jgi:hypothetical protein
MQTLSRLKLNLWWVVATVAIALASWLLVATPARSQTAPVSIQYDDAADVIASSPIQMRLPSVIFPRIAREYHATGSLTTNSAGALEGYNLYVQNNPATCLQALSCSEAYLTGRLIDAGSPTIQEQFRIFYTPGALDGYRVADHAAYDKTLSNGQKITVLPWTHGGASAGYEKAIWDEIDPATGEGIRYIVALKMGNDENLKTMVESAFTQRRGRAGNETQSWDDLVEPIDTQL